MHDKPFRLEVDDTRCGHTLALPLLGRSGGKASQLLGEPAIAPLGQYGQGGVTLSMESSRTRHTSEVKAMHAEPQPVCDAMAAGGAPPQRPRPLLGVVGEAPGRLRTAQARDRPLAPRALGPWEWDRLLQGPETLMTAGRRVDPRLVPWASRARAPAAPEGDKPDAALGQWRALGRGHDLRSKVSPLRMDSGAFLPTRDTLERRASLGTPGERRVGRADDLALVLWRADAPPTGPGCATPGQVVLGQPAGLAPQRERVRGQGAGGGRAATPQAPRRRSSLRGTCAGGRVWCASGSLRRTDVQEPLNAVVTRAYGFSFVLPCLFYSFRSYFQIILDHFPKLYYPSTIMSSLVTKWKKNKPYLYWVRSARVQGQPRIVEQIYLGPRERVLEQLRTQGSVAPQPGAAPPLRTVQTREFGASTLFYTLAQDLGIVDLINAHVPPAPVGRRTSLSVGHYLLLAAVNRAIWAKSKRAFAEWYQTTVLARLLPAASEELSSQRFWDHMHLFEEHHFAPIQQELFTRIRQRFPLGEQFLVYDTTNYSTFMHTFPSRPSLPQRGSNKQKRHDLRQLSLALVVDEERGLPLYYRFYEGNVNDVVALGATLSDMLRQGFPQQAPARLTLVMDKGNVSFDNFTLLKKAQCSFLAAIPAAWVRSFAQVALRQCQPLTLPDGRRIKVYA
jgi:hypothetical protein